jgi:hypothetical protein
MTSAAGAVVAAYTNDLTAWGTVAAAVGTVSAFVVAFLQIRTERRARQRLERQQAAQTHRAQAERVHAWISEDEDDDEHTTIALLNGSHEPVYRAAVFLVFIQGAGPRTGREWLAQASHDEHPPGYWCFLSVIPPGRSRTEIPGGWQILTGRPGLELAFTDGAGAHWLRAGDGSLTEIPQPMVEYYGIEQQPVDWRIPSSRRG